ncbi:helix-turn-helix transcriptional regulator [Candidatus Bathyarchaeota archaeon]|nr:helix-turn-helix transcriptional regulator [Candidatus Bathyarchaeota archaeon]
MNKSDRLEDVFCSKVRMRILKILLQLGQLNISDIANRLGINYGATVTHLRILENNGVVQIRLYGRVRLCRLNDSPKAKAIQEVLETWEKPDL